MASDPLDPANLRGEPTTTWNDVNPKFLEGQRASSLLRYGFPPPSKTPPAPRPAPGPLAHPAPQLPKRSGPTREAVTRRRAVANVSWYEDMAPPACPSTPALATTLGWPIPAVQADRDFAWSAVRKDRLQALFERAPVTCAFAAHPANAALAHDQIPALHNVETAFDRLWHGDPLGFLGDMRDAEIDTVGRMVVEGPVNLGLMLGGAKPLRYDDHPWSEEVRRDVTLGHHFLAGAGAGVVDLLADVDNGVATLEDIGRRKVAQPWINIHRRALGLASIELSAEDDPVNRFFLNNRDRLRVEADEIAPWDDAATHVGRAAGKMAGTVLITVANPWMGVAVMGLSAAGAARDRAEAKGAYASGQADWAILADTGFQTALAVVSGPFAKQAGGLLAAGARPLLQTVARVAAPIEARIGMMVAPVAMRLNPAIRAMLGDVVAPVARSSAENAGWAAAGTAGSNLADKLYNPDARVTDHVIDSALSGALQSGAMTALGHAVATAHRAGKEDVAAAHDLRVAAKASQEAKVQAETFNGAIKATRDLPLKTRDPAAAAKLLGEMSHDGRVLVPVQAVRAAADHIAPTAAERIQVLEAAGLAEPLKAVDAARASATPAQIEALENGRLAVPVGQYLTHIADTPLHALIADHLSFSPGGLSLTQAKVIDTAFKTMPPEIAGPVKAVLEAPPSPAERAYGEQADKALLDRMEREKAASETEAPPATRAEVGNTAAGAASEARAVDDGPGGGSPLQTADDAAANARTAASPEPRIGALEGKPATGADPADASPRGDADWTASEGSATARGYTVAFEMELDRAHFGKSRAVHFNRAAAALEKHLADPAYAAMLEASIPGIREAVSSRGGRRAPDGWTWEHASTSTTGGRPGEPGRQGVMRLVPTSQHTPGSAHWRALHPDAGARGGYSEWAIPNGAPKNRSSKKGK